MSYAETGPAGRAHDDAALNCAEYGKWASDFAHAYYALVKGEADLGELMDWAYDIWPQRVHESPIDVARQWFNALPDETRARYLAGGKADMAFRQWRASLSG